MLLSTISPSNYSWKMQLPSNKFIKRLYKAFPKHAISKLGCYLHKMSIIDDKTSLYSHHIWFQTIINASYNKSLIDVEIHYFVHWSSPTAYLVTNPAAFKSTMAYLWERTRTSGVANCIKGCMFVDWSGQMASTIAHNPLWGWTPPIDFLLIQVILAFWCKQMFIKLQSFIGAVSILQRSSIHPS